MSLKYFLATTTVLGSLAAMAACQASFTAGSGTTPGATSSAGGGSASATPVAAVTGSPTQAEPAASATAASTAASAATTEAAPPAKAKATVGGGKVVPQGTLTFDSGMPILLATPENEAILDDLKLLLDQNSSITQMRIEGYSDGAGNADANLELSGQRALVIKKALIDRGVAQERVLAVGFGDKKPKTGQNQRIEFKVAVWNGKNYLNQQPTGGGKKFE